MIYIVAFLSSLLFLKLSFLTDKKNKELSKLLQIMGILIPCLLASLRDYTIGTDVNVYVQPLFEASKGHSSFITFYQAITNVKDILYLLVTYVCSHISNDIGLLFFVNELLVITPIYIALKKRFKSNSSCVLIGMSLFYLFFYNQSYNLARQSIAISFIILGLAYLDENKIKKFLVSFLVACLFHNTAKIFVFIFILYKILSSNKINKRLKLVLELVILSGCCALIFFLPQAINVLQKLNILSKNEVNVYISNFQKDSIDINYIHSIIYLFVLFIVLIYKKRIKSNETKYDYYIFSSFLSFIILQVGNTIDFAERIGYYVFYPILITIVPYVIWREDSKRKITKNDFIITSIVIITFIVYWYVEFCVLKHSATYPYILR